ncbi:MAG: hypothetical protein WCI65_06805 [Synechococcaceae cyanobacterium ELA263]
MIKAIAAAALLSAAALMTGSPAEAVVYCTGAGVPRGCVVRRPVATATPVVVNPVVVRPVVVTPAYRPAAGPGVGPNLGGPVNHVGPR